MTRPTLISVFVFGMMGVNASAAIFVDNFDLYGDYTQYLDSTDNARVYTEGYWPAGPTHYWAPISRSDWGEVVYKYDLPFSIESASIDASILALTWHDSTAEGYLDVSPNGVDWTQVLTAGLNSFIDPIDVTSYLAGSDTAYIRARLRSRNSPIGAQFLRTTPNPNNPQTQAPEVYEFRAEGANVVPEPSTFVIFATLATLGIAWGWWRRR
ncbi:MAG: PEP-CTERM sorting domain-containing protein [Pirellulales bacterium]|nr:PEP-CTERM sorting domain-containing protein [Pirellulales bacterium]